MRYINDFLSNSILWTAVLSWVVAQVLKVILVFMLSKKLDFKRLVGSGGMPSSHSSFVVSLSVAVGIEQGFASPMFAISFALAMIIMYDASGVRRAAGQQARLLNRMVEEWGKGDFSRTEKKLKELLGHTPMEVCGGALLGILIAVIRHL